MLAKELRAALKMGAQIMMVHENDEARGGCAFSTFFQTTPQELIDGGLYRPFATAFMSGDKHRTASKSLFARALGAKVVKWRATQTIKFAEVPTFVEKRSSRMSIR
eukprot:6449450-Prymnesium_polylepis.1